MRPQAKIDWESIEYWFNVDDDNSPTVRVGDLIESRTICRVEQVDGKGLAFVRQIGPTEGWVSAKAPLIDADDPRLEECGLNENDPEEKFENDFEDLDE